MVNERDAVIHDLFEFLKETICTLTDAEAEAKATLPPWASDLRDEATRLICLHGERA